MEVGNELRQRGLGWLDRNQRVRDAAVAEWARARRAGSSILDVGAGFGRYAALFTHCSYTAHDHPDVEYAAAGFIQVRGDITAIPLPDGSQQAILCSEVLEHVEDPLAALVEFRRLLAPGGELFLTVPAACRVHRVPTHYWGGFAPDFFERAMPARGLELIELRPMGNWSQWLAQEVGRFPSVLRDGTRLPAPLGRALGIAAWPLFRLALPGLLLAFSKLDRTEDLPLGWIARARRRA